jgi:cbb3-type cytochrome oxidase maturation protein
MNILYLLIPVTFCMGLVALATFLWSLRARQYDDLSGAAERVLLTDENEPLPRPGDGRAGPAAPTYTTEETR